MPLLAPESQFENETLVAGEVHAGDDDVGVKYYSHA